MLDIADLYRDKVTLKVAFGAVKEAGAAGNDLERLVRRRAAEAFSKEQVIPSMIDHIKQVLGEDGS